MARKEIGVEKRILEFFKRNGGSIEKTVHKFEVSEWYVQALVEDDLRRQAKKRDALRGLVSAGSLFILAEVFNLLRPFLLYFA